MKHRFFSIFAFLMVLFLVTACAAQPQVASTVESQPSLADELVAGGATVETGEAIEQSFFTGQGKILKVNGVEVQVFEYETAEALAQDVAQVSPDGGQLGNNMVRWMATPHFFKEDRVLVVYIGDDAAVLDLLNNVMGAQFAGG